MSTVRLLRVLLVGHLGHWGLRSLRSLGLGTPGLRVTGGARSLGSLRSGLGHFNLGSLWLGVTLAGVTLVWGHFGLGSLWSGATLV